MSSLCGLLIFLDIIIHFKIPKVLKKGHSYLYAKMNQFFGYVLSHRTIFSIIHDHAFIHCHLLVGGPHSLETIFDFIHYPSHLIQLIGLSRFITCEGAFATYKHLAINSYLFLIINCKIIRQRYNGLFLDQ
jgi:hypothetical protein